MRPPCLVGTDVAILAGGLGTRISGVLGDTPKILAPVGGRPFLDHLFDWLSSFGASRIVLCLGHLADKVTAHVSETPRDDLRIEWTIESAPLGTGGALRQASSLLDSDPVLVMNGDTWIDLDLCEFLAGFRQASADIGLACAPAASAARFDRVTLRADGYVQDFSGSSRGTDEPGLVNGGFYLFSQAALAALRAGTARSLEHDVLHRQPAGTVLAFETREDFIDIGTPESLAKAGAFMANARSGTQDMGQ